MQFRLQKHRTGASLVQSMANIFEYSNISDPNIYSDIRSYQNFDTNVFGYSFVSKKFTRIYSDIRSWHFLDTNIFGYSFVSKSIQMSHYDSYPLLAFFCQLLEYMISFNFPTWCVLFPSQLINLRNLEAKQKIIAEVDLMRKLVSINIIITPVSFNKSQ